MKRDLQALANTTYDIVIIGGGVHGLLAAWDATLRGWKVALVERGDFGSGTSSASFRLIHGGLRHLQHLDFARMRLSIRERNWMMRSAPHLMKPLPFALPCYGHGLRGPELMRAALAINDMISKHRNDDLPHELHIPNGSILSKDQLVERAPALPTDDVTGAALFHDAQVQNPERHMMAMVRSAHQAGAVLANYVEATGLEITNGRVDAVIANDVLTDDPFVIQTRMALNMTGPWSRIVQSMLTDRPSTSRVFSKGIQVLTKSIGKETAFAFDGRRADPSAIFRRGNMQYFVTPWHGCSFIGTTDEPCEGDPDEFHVSKEDIQRFLGELNDALPDVDLSMDDVHFWYGGLRPAKVVHGRHVMAARKERVVDHRSDGVTGMISVEGVKYTTARWLAERSVDAAQEQLGTTRESCTTYQRSLAEDQESKDLRETVLHSVRNEMAMRLEDVIFRRTEIGMLGRPKDDLIENIAVWMADELKWTEAQANREIDRVNQRFTLT